MEALRTATARAIVFLCRVLILLHLVEAWAM